MRPLSETNNEKKNSNISTNSNFLKKSNSMFEIHYLNRNNRKYVNGMNGQYISSQKGLMHRFIQSKGKLSSISTVRDSKSIISWVPDYDIDTIRKRSFQKIERKNFIPIEERIQKELQEMKNREDELKNQRRSLTTTIENLPLKKSIENVEKLSKFIEHNSCEINNNYLLNSFNDSSNLNDKKADSNEKYNEIMDSKPNSKLLIEHWEKRIQRLREQ